MKLSTKQIMDHASDRPEQINDQNDRKTKTKEQATRCDFVNQGNTPSPGSLGIKTFSDC